MKSEAAIALSTAVLSLAFLSGSFQAQAESTQSTSQAKALAARMVPAQAQFSKTLEGSKVQAGQQFEVSLVQKVKLSDGQELPRGTVLEGKIVTDKMQASGNSKLVLRFTDAKLKDGKSIPIQAVATGLYSEGSMDAQYGNSDWNPSELAVEQLNATGGLSLHSSIGSSNSVTLESKKDDVKVDHGSALFLAIAPSKVSPLTGE